MKATSILVLAACLAINQARAQNLLLNGDFSSPNSNAAADDWTTWSYGGGWANHQNNTEGVYDGDPNNSLMSYYMADGGGSSAGGGEYQTLSASAGLTYQLTVDSGAQAWWLPYGEMRMFFLDASQNQLAEDFQSTVDPAVYGQNYDIPHPWSTYTMTAVAPSGTALIKVEFAEPNGTGTVWFDDAVLTVVPEPALMAFIGLGLVTLFGYRR